MCIVNKDGDAEWNAGYYYFVLKISVQFNNLRAANFNKLNLPPFSTYIWRCSEGSVHTELSSQDLRDWAWFRITQFKLHVFKCPTFYTTIIPFLKPTWVHKTGGNNVYTQYTCMQEARAYYGDIKLQIERNRNMSTRTAIATRFLYVLIFFGEKVWIWFCCSV